MFLGVQVKVSNPHIIKINDSAMTQHRAMYTGKRIIPQNIYIYIYKFIYIMWKFGLDLFSCEQTHEVAGWFEISRS